MLWRGVVRLLGGVAAFGSAEFWAAANRERGFAKLTIVAASSVEAQPTG